MYFGNIADKELVKYPKPTINNFSIRLSDILHQTSGTFDNKLFKIEEIITDKLYKIYPMFNCTEINSTNSADEIFDNHLIICTKEDKETYITFKSNDSGTTDYLDYGTYYEIGDDLTTNPFNSIVSLLRRTPIQHSIRIQPHTIETDYGTIDFQFTGLILDNGIKVTDLTTLKCKLSNPHFRYSNYHLNINVLRLGNPNIETEDATDKTIIPLTIDLDKDTWIDIPTTDLQTGDIILYDCILNITHDKPEIHYLAGLEVTANPNPIQKNNTTDVYCQLLDVYGYDHSESGKTIYFYEVVTPTLTMNATADVIQTADTVDIFATYKDEDGSIVSGGVVHFYEVFDFANLRLSATKSVMQVDDIVDITARLSDSDGSAISNEIIDFYEIVEPTLKLEGDKSNIQTNDTMDLKATLKDEDGSRVVGEKVYFYEKED